MLGKEKKNRRSPPSHQNRHPIFACQLYKLGKEIDNLLGIIEERTNSIQLQLYRNANGLLGRLKELNPILDSPQMSGTENSDIKRFITEFEWSRKHKEDPCEECNNWVPFFSFRKAML